MNWSGRSLSLRVRVALAAALAAAVVVALLSLVTSVVLANNDNAQLDRRLDSIVDASMFPEQLRDPSRVLTTGRSRSTGQVVFQRGFQLPPLPPGTATVTVNTVDYRVRTVSVDQSGGILVSIGIRADSILLSRARIPLYVFIVCLAVMIAAALGWILAGPAIRPLLRLTEQTRRLGKGSDRLEPVHGAAEAEDLSEAMVAMLHRLADAQVATTNSLQAAQDFAANAAHELRTPLTAMRADLDTLRIHDLPPEEREEVVGDLSRAQRRVEAIITALGQLASGQLARAEDRESIDVAEMLDRVARENVRSGAVEIIVEADEAGTVWGWPAGLRLAVDNLVRNAITHGEATRIVLRASRHEAMLAITVDDNGRGLPAEEHRKVLGRFARGSTATAGGSGLGLALVAQQAALHGGDIELSDGPLGGLRAVLTVAAFPGPEFPTGMA
ncbi:signal transduction histidine kinase [Mycolicibacterium sp. BK634]|uniref:sensor histidine kinase n=1 Tax=Mycobacteriaceae TaxID=1762 RepID=UPI00105C0485|nr:HAMP domain-containing sensor histidine kinase [Mycobacterium sp. BK086]MBB3748510.1 signal transduction histidine kinase [Mycolicibacterium sp. BK634]TDO10306.1 signal transduction histidine kinase [Mycobacterium sp. BK086]